MYNEPLIFMQWIVSIYDSCSIVVNLIYTIGDWVMIHISDIIINLTRKHLNQLNLYNLQFMRVGFNITADVWNLTPNCWNSGSIILDKDI